MALTYDQITAITNELYLPMFPQLFADRNILQKRLHAKGTKPQGGEQIKQHVFYQQSKGGFYAEYDTFDISAEDQITAAFWPWKYLEVPITLSRADVLRNAGAPAVKSLMDAKMKGAAIRASQLLATSMFSLTGVDSSLGLNSLDNMCTTNSEQLSTGTAVYGGIDRSTPYTWWDGNTLDPGDIDIDYAVLSDAEALVLDGDIRPTIWMLGPNSFNSYMKAEQADQRYMKQSDMDTGFVTAQFNGRVIAQDRYVSDPATGTSASRAYGLNEEFLDMVTHANENMRLEPFAKPVDQAVIVGHIMWAGNLVSCDPSRHVVIHDQRP
jgi:hypothetical protein